MEVMELMELLLACLVWLDMSKNHKKRPESSAKWEVRWEGKEEKDHILISSTRYLYYA